MSHENIDAAFANDEDFPDNGDVVMQPLDSNAPQNPSRRRLGRKAVQTALTIGAGLELVAAVAESSDGLTIADLQRQNAQLQQELVNNAGQEAARINAIREQDFSEGIDLLFNGFVGDDVGYGQAINNFSIDKEGIATIEAALMNGEAETRLAAYERIQPTTRQVVAERHPDKDGQWQLEMQLMLAYVGTRTTITPDLQSAYVFSEIDDSFRATQFLNTTYTQELPGIQAIAPQVRRDFIDPLVYFSPVYNPK